MSFQCVAHFCCSTVTVCLCGFLRCLGQKIESNITLLPLPLPLHGTQPSNTHKRTHVNHGILGLLTFVVCVWLSVAYVFVLRVLQISPLPHLSAWPLISSLYFLFFLCVIHHLHPCSLSSFCLFRVTWLLARVNQVGMSTTPWFCTTTTVPAGQSSSSFLFQLTCFGGHMSGLSSGTVPVSRRRVVDNLYLSRKG